MKKTKYGTMYDFGDVILTEITFTDQSIAKRRPALVLFEEHDNSIVAGITSNLKMQGISLSVDEGAVRESIIKTNYLFTVGKSIIVRKLFKLKKEKKKIVCEEIKSKICGRFSSK
jgi:mRNA interferase MazF